MAAEARWKDRGPGPSSRRTAAVARLELATDPERSPRARATWLKLLLFTSIHRVVVHPAGGTEACRQPTPLTARIPLGRVPVMMAFETVYGVAVRGALTGVPVADGRASGTASRRRRSYLATADLFRQANGGNIGVERC